MDLNTCFAALEFIEYYTLNKESGLVVVSKCKDPPLLEEQLLSGGQEFCGSRRISEGRGPGNTNAIVYSWNTSL
jgi:hypothetical protein